MASPIGTTSRRQAPEPLSATRVNGLHGQHGAPPWSKSARSNTQVAADGSPACFDSEPETGSSYFVILANGRKLVRPFLLVQVLTAPESGADRSESTGAKDDAKGPQASVREPGRARSMSHGRRARRVRHEQAGRVSRKLIRG
jgi:hypothetical protein